jgi:hypothetical protein
MPDDGFNDLLETTFHLVFARKPSTRSDFLQHDARYAASNWHIYHKYRPPPTSQKCCRKQCSSNYPKWAVWIHRAAERISDKKSWVTAGIGRASADYATNGKY